MEQRHKYFCSRCGCRFADIGIAKPRPSTCDDCFTIWLMEGRLGVLVDQLAWEKKKQAERVASNGAGK